MTEQEMWEAVIQNDSSYDGVFFYAVKTTGIYCRPSCKSKPPKRGNICFFQTAQEARRLLLDTDTKVIDIAYQVGFGSLAAFYSFFKKETGKTPSGYRKEGMEHE